MVLDQTADVTREAFLKFANIYGLPDYVRKSPEAEVFAPAADLPPTAFADSQNRQFPVHTKAATETSFRYFLEHEHQLHPKIASMVRDRFLVMARYWGIESDLRSLQEKRAQLNIVPPVPDADYLLVYKTDNGPERHYPLTGGPATKAAADWFLQHRDHFPYADRNRMAIKLLEKAAQYAVDLSRDQREQLEKQAGYGVCDVDKTAAAIQHRLRAVDARRVSPEITQSMQKLATELINHPELATEPATLTNLCETIDVFDKLAELTNQYGTLLPRPEDAVFAVTLDTMRETVKNACTLTTGHVFDRHQFAKLSVQELRDSYGENLVAAVCDVFGQQVDPVKLAEVAATLPRGEANLLVRMLARHGEQPLFKQADAPVRFSPAELQALAAVDNFAAALGDADVPSPTV